MCGVLPPLFFLLGSVLDTFLFCSTHSLVKRRWKQSGGGGIKNREGGVLDRLVIKSKRGGNLVLFPVQNCWWRSGGGDQVGWNSVGTENSTRWQA